MVATMDDLIATVEDGQELPADRVGEAAAALLDEAVEDDAKVRFLSGLAAKGETPAEIAAFVDAFLAHAVDPGLDPAEMDFPLVDVCGTGGDKLQLFNVSTTSMFVVAAAGAGVVKHGNRGITSKCGGADVLEELGIRIDLPPDRFAEAVRTHGVGFMLAPQYHPAFKAVVPVRKILAGRGTRTIFNLVGPLLNPARPPFQLVGTFEPSLTLVFAEILRTLGRTRAWAVCGRTGDGRAMDELSVLGPTDVAALDVAGSIGERVIDPADLGIPEHSLEELQGGDAAQNAAILTGILGGSITGAKREMVILNAGAALVVAGVAHDLGGGRALAEEAIESGAALGKVRSLQHFS
ncbi:anthranilate phosphoribosyltransferase [soil metagenome]